MEVSRRQWVLLVSTSREKFESEYHTQLTAKAMRLKSVRKDEIFIQMVLELHGVRILSRS